MRVLISLALLMGSVLGSHASDSSQSPPVQLMIDLPQILSRSANPVYHGDKEAFRNLTLLMQDVHSRLTFVSENVLAVYFNRPPEQNNEGTSATYSMEVFFVSTDSGGVIEHRTWSTLKRNGSMIHTIRKAESSKYATVS